MMSRREVSDASQFSDASQVSDASQFSDGSELSDVISDTDENLEEKVEKNVKENAEKNVTHLSANDRLIMAPTLCLVGKDYGLEEVYHVYIVKTLSLSYSCCSYLDAGRVYACTCIFAGYRNTYKRIQVCRSGGYDLLGQKRRNNETGGKNVKQNHYLNTY